MFGVRPLRVPRRYAGFSEQQLARFRALLAAEIEAEKQTEVQQKEKERVQETSRLYRKSQAKEKRFYSA